MAQWVTCLLCRSEGRSLDPQIPYEARQVRQPAVSSELGGWHEVLQQAGY